MAYKFNNGFGAILCDKCSYIITHSPKKEEILKRPHICKDCKRVADTQQER
jgi:RNA polymerase subunit RPABC4/transcription elongation factor Spt4